MTALGDATSVTAAGGGMQLRAMLEVLAPLALAVGVWAWSTLRRGARRGSRRNWGAPGQPQSQGMSMLYDMESGSQRNPDLK